MTNESPLLVALRQTVGVELQILHDRFCKSFSLAAMSVIEKKIVEGGASMEQAITNHKTLPLGIAVQGVELLCDAKTIEFRRKLVVDTISELFAFRNPYQFSAKVKAKE